MLNALRGAPLPYIFPSFPREAAPSNNISNIRYKSFSKAHHQEDRKAGPVPSSSFLFFFLIRRVVAERAAEAVLPESIIYSAMQTGVLGPASNTHQSHL